MGFHETRLKLTATRIPHDLIHDMKIWLKNYETYHKDHPDYQKLVFSDLVRFSIELFLETKYPKQTFFPK